MAGRPITVAETALFVGQANGIWDAAEREEFVDFIARNPEAGDVIPETGGVRKLHWRRAGTGKRGGVLVVYFYYDPDSPLYLLLVYAKAEREDITPEETRTVRKLTVVLKTAAQNRRS